MGLTVTTSKDKNGQDSPVKVIAKERNGYTFYSLMVSSKDKNGEWVNGFIDCTFKKGVSVNNKAKIIIKDAFYTVSKYNDKTYTKLMIMDFSVVDEGEGAPVNTANQSLGYFMSIPEGIMEEMPFN